MFRNSNDDETTGTKEDGRMPWLWWWRGEGVRGLPEVVGGGGAGRSRGSGLPEVLLGRSEHTG